MLRNRKTQYSLVSEQSDPSKPDATETKPIVPYVVSEPLSSSKRKETFRYMDLVTHLLLWVALWFAQATYYVQIRRSSNTNSKWLVETLYAEALMVYIIDNGDLYGSCGLPQPTCSILTNVILGDNSDSSWQAQDSCDVNDSPSLCIYPMELKHGRLVLYGNAFRSLSNIPLLFSPLYNQTSLFSKMSEVFSEPDYPETTSEMTFNHKANLKKSGIYTFLSRAWQYPGCKHNPGQRMYKYEPKDYKQQFCRMSVKLTQPWSLWSSIPQPSFSKNGGLTKVMTIFSLEKFNELCATLFGEGGYRQPGQPYENHFEKYTQFSFTNCWTNFSITNTDDCAANIMQSTNIIYPSVISDSGMTNYRRLLSWAYMKSGQSSRYASLTNAQMQNLWKLYTETEANLSGNEQEDILPGFQRACEIMFDATKFELPSKSTLCPTINETDLLCQLTPKYWIPPGLYGILYGDFSNEMQILDFKPYSLEGWKNGMQKTLETGLYDNQIGTYMQGLTPIQCWGMLDNSNTRREMVDNVVGVFSSASMLMLGISFALLLFLTAFHWWYPHGIVGQIIPTLIGVLVGSLNASLIFDLIETLRVFITCGLFEMVKMITMSTRLLNGFSEGPRGTIADFNKGIESTGAELPFQAAWWAVAVLSLKITVRVVIRTNIDYFQSEKHVE